MLDALRLAFQALTLGHFVLEGRRPGDDLLLQGRVEVVERLVPRVQLGQGRGLRGDMLLLQGVQLPEFVLATAGPQGHLHRTQQGDGGERALQHRDVADRAQRLYALPQGRRRPGAAGQQNQGEIGPDGLPLQRRAQHVEGQRRQRFVSEEGRRGRVHRRAHLLHVVADVRPYPGRVQPRRCDRRIPPGGGEDQHRLLHPRGRWRGVSRLTALHRCGLLHPWGGPSAPPATR